MRVRAISCLSFACVAVVQLAACGQEQAGPIETEAGPAASHAVAGPSAQQFGTAGDDMAFDLVVQGGSIYAGGVAQGAGGADALLSRHDRQGNVVWLHTFGTWGFDEVRGVAADQTGVYAVGWVEGGLPGQADNGGGDAYIRKYDGQGTELWTRQFGTPARDNAIAVHAAGGVVHVAGFTWGTLPGQVSAGDADGFVRAYDADGNELWTRQFGTPRADLLIGLAVDGGALYLTGSTGGTMGDAGNAGADDVFLLKYDEAGNELWARQFGSDQFDMGMNVSAGPSGVYVSGFTSGALPGFTSAGSGDAFVRAYDLDGSELWTDQFGSAAFDNASGVAIAGRSVHVTGSGGPLTDAPSGGATDGFLRTYDRDGDIVGTRVFGSDGADEVAAVEFRGGIFIVGTTSGTMDGQSGLGGSDLFLARVHPR